MKEEQSQQDNINEIKIIREVRTQAGAFYEEAKELGDRAAVAFGKKHRSQLTGLESIAESAFTISEIFDYIKRQTARHDAWRENNFGKDLLEKLDTRLASRQKVISSGLKISDKTEAERQVRRRIHLLLIRQFIRQLVVEYEFQASFGKGAKNNGAD